MFERPQQFLKIEPAQPLAAIGGWTVARGAPIPHGGTLQFRICKRGFDIVGSLLLLAPALILGCALLILNPRRNPGALIYRQVRMGRDCRPIHTYKFRTMQPCADDTRGPNDPLEAHRITDLGQTLRRLRLDELPQIINVLRGEMSLIGPRPDYFPHAHSFLLTVPGYRERHVIRPGISGLAQVEVGYVSGSLGTRRKVLRDLEYIRTAGFAVEARIVWRTICIVLAARGF